MTIMRKKNTYFALAGSIAISLAAGFIGSLATSPAIPTWYASLEKPFFNPPNWLFGPVWTVLYILMGIALWLVLSEKKQSPERTRGIQLFFVQLVLNSLWSLIFFGLKQPPLAFAEIIVLWISIAITMLYFYKVKKLAAYLLIPYIAWVSFASALNLAIAILN